MKKHLCLRIQLTLVVLSLMISALAFGQAAQTPAQPTVPPGVPRLVKFSGVLKDASGKLLSKTVGIMFSIYSEQTGGVPLWQETQNLQFSQGRYTVFLGESTSAGIPAELFASGQPRWLGVKPLLPGEEEQPRVLLASVPYALKAVDADTLGGLPASAFLQANGGNSTSVVVASATAADPGTGGVKRPSTAVTTSGGTVGTIPYFKTSTDIESVPTMNYSTTTGVVGVRNLENIIFPDQLTPSLSLCNVTTGTDASAKIQCAINLLPAAGGVVDARNLSDATGTGSTAIDPGAKAVTLLLGPYTYQILQIKLETNFRIIGAGSGPGGTILQSANASYSAIVMGSNPIESVLLNGFRLLGKNPSGSGSQNGIDIHAQPHGSTGGGLWYSEFRDLQILNFNGVSVNLDGSVMATPQPVNQFLSFRDVRAIRPNDNSYGLQILGSAGQLLFENCEFDGPSQAGTNIFIAATSLPNFILATDIEFLKLTSQHAAIAVDIRGAYSVRFLDGHYEDLATAVFELDYGETGVPDIGIVIDGSYFGQKPAQGPYLLITTSAAKVVFENNSLIGIPTGPAISNTGGGEVCTLNNLALANTVNIPVNLCSQ